MPAHFLSYFWVLILQSGCYSELSNLQDKYRGTESPGLHTDSGLLRIHSPLNMILQTLRVLGKNVVDGRMRESAE